MDAETRTLFESALLDLAKTRKHEGRLVTATASATTKNPFCGDEITVDVEGAGDQLAAFGYEAKACSLCVASAELLSQWMAEGQNRSALEQQAAAIVDLLRGGEAPQGLEALTSVAPFRARHKCVTLPWEAATKAAKEISA